MSRFSRSVSIFLFALALVVRLSGLFLRGEYHAPPEPTIIGAEAGEIAHHLLAGHGFATPFDTSDNPSPSTHLPPLYPYFLTGLGAMGLSRFWIFTVAITLNLLASAFLPVLALNIGTAARFPKPVSLIAALAFCFCPEALRAVGLVWDEALMTTLTALLILYMIRKLAPPFDPALSHEPPPTSNAPDPAPIITVTIGLLNGALALLNPAMCIALPCAWLAALQARGMSLKKLPAYAFLLAATTFLGSSPWHFRNWFLLDPPAPVFIRGNFWLEVWSSLHPVAQIKYPDGTTHPLPVHPWQGSESLLRTNTVPPTPLTEQQYFAWCKERVFATFRETPRLLFQQIATQFNAFWLGIAEAKRWARNPVLFFIAQGLPAIAGIIGYFAARKRIPPEVAAILCTLLILFPLPYYLTGGGARYRHPIDLPLYFGVAWLVYLATIRLFPRASFGITSNKPIMPS